MCELAGVSRASFYRNWEHKEPTVAEMAVRDAIQRAALAHRYYGYRRIAAYLHRQGFMVTPKKVRRLMRADNLMAVRRRRFVVTTESGQRFRVHPNLAENLEITDINQLWVADLTYLRLEQGFVYLAVVLDAYSRRVIGWALGRSLEVRLTLEALELAITARQPKPGLVHHSDQGIQYVSQSYVDRLESCGAILSMSRPGSPWENGRCESFIKTLKHEELEARPYRTIEDLRDHVTEFIDQIYNVKRLHSALAYRSPVEFEQQHESDRAWRPATLSFLRHEEIYPDGEFH
jgi:transposase InsO family protein